MNPKWIRNPQWILCIFFLSLYLLTNGGHTYSNDEESMFFVTAAMARRAEFDNPPPSQAPIARAQIGVDGKLYPPYGLAPSAVALPFYHVGSVIAAWFPREYNGFFLRLPFVLLLNPLFTALTIALLFQAAVRLGYSTRAALLTVFAYGVGTFAWAYSKTFFSEPLATLLLMVAFVALLEFRAQPRLQFVAASGIALGLAAATKVTAAINLPLYFLFLLWLVYARRAQMTTRRMWLTMVVWGTGVGVMLAGVGIFNFMRFGNFFSTGYQGENLFGLPLWEGLYGLVLSPGKGLLFYAPLVLLTLPALWLFAKQHRAVALFCASSVALHLGAFGMYTYWHGDSAWGPRFLVFILPFLILPLAALFEFLAQPRAARWRPFVAALLFVSVLIQVLSVAVNFDIYLNTELNQARRYFVMDASPLVGQARVLFEVLTNTPPYAPMPEGAIARFGWFFDPAQPHPLDFWFLYLVHSGIPISHVAFFVAPILLVCVLGLVWSSSRLWRLWKISV